MDGKRGIRKVPLYQQRQGQHWIVRRGSQARAADKHDEWSASCHGDNATTTDNSVTHSL